jgi:ribosomal protein S18 acetylase RimI-like enzyme
VRLRRLRADEVEPLRELRLRALSEDPGAFAETLEEARDRPLEDWVGWAADASVVIVVAIEGERWVGMVACRQLEPGSTWLTALWVDPAHRGGGLGSRLIEAAADWAREQGAATLELSVTTNNDAAARLYGRTGFIETGRRRPLPSDPSRTEVFLSRPLVGVPRSTRRRAPRA